MVSASGDAVAPTIRSWSRNAETTKARRVEAMGIFHGRCIIMLMVWRATKKHDAKKPTIRKKQRCKYLEKSELRSLPHETIRAKATHNEMRHVKIRLHQFLSRCGVFSSKKDVKAAIWNGEVSVAGSVVKDIAFQFNANTKQVHLNGNLLTLPNMHTTFVINKAEGLLCSRLNKQERALGKTSVFAALRAPVKDSVYDRLLTVGRLDEQTTGLLVITTDGHLVHEITSPDARVEKTYAVVIDKVLTPDDRRKLSTGVEIDMEVNGVKSRYTTRPAKVEETDSTTVRLTITEGKKRQVRRMFASLGYTVQRLHRTSIGGLRLDLLDLEVGDALELDAATVRQLVFEERVDKRP